AKVRGPSGVSTATASGWRSTIASNRWCRRSPGCQRGAVSPSRVRTGDRLARSRLSRPASLFIVGNPPPGRGFDRVHPRAGARDCCACSAARAWLVRLPASRDAGNRWWDDPGWCGRGLLGRGPLGRRDDERGFLEDVEAPVEQIDRDGEGGEHLYHLAIRPGGLDDQSRIVAASHHLRRE